MVIDNWRDNQGLVQNGAHQNGVLEPEGQPVWGLFSGGPWSRYGYVSSEEVHGCFSVSGLFWDFRYER